MTAGPSPVDLVLALVRVINGELPPSAARRILDPMVELHMDARAWHGIDVWFGWIDFIRTRGGVSDLRMVQCQVCADTRQPSLVHLSGRWAGTSRRHKTNRMATTDGHARYLVRDGRITAIWTQRANYEFIFGRWIVNPLGRWLLPALTFVHFALSSRRKDHAADLS